MPTPNIPALRATLRHIKANPHEWEQQTWRCKTGMCFAGHAAILNGGRWLRATSVESESATVVHPETGDLLHVQDFAMEVLGLANYQADELFHHENTITDLEEIIDDLAQEQ